MSSITSDYYQKVNQYYNVDAADFEKRYYQNGILQDIRKAFQNIVERYQFNSAIEIGFGPGIDLEYFSKKYQERSFFGIDISSEMTAITQHKIVTNNVDTTSSQVFHTLLIVLNDQIEIMGSCFYFLVYR